MNANFINTININPTRPILVVSDIHLGQRSVEEETIFLNTLIRLAKDYLIIINGDFFELWKYGRFGWNRDSNYKKYLEIWDMHKGLLTTLLLETPDVYYIHGNHDFLLALYDTPFKVYRHIILREKDHPHGQIMVEHGNNADEYSNENMLNGCKYLVKTGIDYVSQKLFKLWSWTLSKEVRVNEIIYIGMGKEKKYISHAKTLGYRTVVFGHTHQLGAVFDEHFFYYNSGCCLLHIQAVCIDGDDIYIRVWPFEGP